MKCLLCNDWIESVPKLRDLITFNQREEYSCVSCKNQFKKLSKERCQNCNKELHRDTCIDCKLWMKKGYIPKHLAIYRYEENMKDYFSRYKFMGDYCLRKTFQKDIKNKTNIELKTENISILFNPAINNALSADPANAKYFRSLNSSFVRKIPQKTQHIRISIKLAIYSIIQSRQPLITAAVFLFFKSCFLWLMLF